MTVKFPSGVFSGHTISSTWGTISLNLSPGNANRFFRRHTVTASTFATEISSCYTKTDRKLGIIIAFTYTPCKQFIDYDVENLSISCRVSSLPPTFRVKQVRSNAAHSDWNVQCEFPILAAKEPTSVILRKRRTYWTVTLGNFLARLPYVRVNKLWLLVLSPLPLRLTLHISFGLAGFSWNSTFRINKNSLSNRIPYRIPTVEKCFALLFLRIVED